ncbi:MAG: FIST N-terminal domain-containing protein [Bacteroidota bacterium]
MKSISLKYEDASWTTSDGALMTDKITADLVLCFGSKQILNTPGFYSIITSKFNAPQIVICSTSGEIIDNQVTDNTLVAVALQFEKTKIETSNVNILDFKNSYDAAAALVNKLPKTDLAYVLIISDGSLVNGSELVKGLNDSLDNNVLITGSLAGDGANFESTLVGLNNEPQKGQIVAVAFYGKNILVTSGSKGGWDILGPEKIITKAKGNILFELDHKNCLDLYKRFLGDEAAHLPSSALLFPLSVITPDNTKAVVRTILNISEAEQSMTFAGDVPEGSKVRFMKANFDSLITAASNSAQQTLTIADRKPDFSLLISCVGRKLTLGSRIEEEVESINELFEGKTPLLGFYSYGEISPIQEEVSCSLHNQTMTITSFYEF